MLWQYSFRVTDSLERIENINYKKRMLYVNLRFMLLVFPRKTAQDFKIKALSKSKLSYYSEFYFIHMATLKDIKELSSDQA